VRNIRNWTRSLRAKPRQKRKWGSFRKPSQLAPQLLSMLTVSPTYHVLILAGAGVSAKSGIPTTAECRQFSISAVAC
jgi:hypothetical protein